MAHVRWEPVRELHSLQQEMNRLFGTFFDAPTAGTAGGGGALRRWTPAMDLVETEDRFVLRADLPGLSEGDVSVELEDNVLTIAGDRRAEHEAQQEGFYRIERPSGSFSRSLTLPDGVDADGIEANFRDGVLEVRVPKPVERQPRRVAISVGGGSETIEGTQASSSGASSTPEPVGASA